MERGPVQLNIPRDMFYGDVNTTIPEPMNIERSAGIFYVNPSIAEPTNT